MLNTKKRQSVNYRFMIVYTIIFGVIGIVLQFISDFELMAFILPALALGGLIGGSNDYEERDRQQLEKSYKLVFEWQMLITLAAFAFLALSRLFVVLEGPVAFLNTHWPGLIICIMCILVGIAGFQRRILGGST
jgi:hypothetical protein